MDPEGEDDPTERGPAKRVRSAEVGGDAPHSVEDWLRRALADSMLWPVFAVLVAVALTLGAGILLFALHVRNPGGIAALAILLLMSIDAIRQDVKARGFGWISRGIVALWLGSSLAALAAYALGLADLA